MKNEAEYWQARWRHAHWVPKAFVRSDPSPPPKARRRKPLARSVALEAPPIEISTGPLDEALGLTAPAAWPAAPRRPFMLSRYDIFAAIALAGGSLGLALHNFTGGIVMLLIAAILAALDRGDL